MSVTRLSLRRPRGVGVGAWIAVLVAIAAAGCTSGRAASQSPIGPLAGSPATTVAAAGHGPAFEWSADNSPVISTLDSGAATTITAVMAPSAAGGTWMVAGTRSPGPGVSAATVWTSSDTKSWTASQLPSSSLATRAEGMATWEGATVVVGSSGTGLSQRAAVWISPAPGSPFVAAPVSDKPPGRTDQGTALQGGPSLMDTVTAGNLGFFASGTLGGQPAVWYSTNGRSWSLSASGTRFFAGEDGAHIYTLLATSGQVYAAGSLHAGNATDAAVWSTNNGLDWHAANPPPGAFSGQGDRVITGLAELGGGQPGGREGLVAVGGVYADGIWSPASWISPDGTTWSQPYADFPEDGAGAAPGGIARALVAVPGQAGTTVLYAVGEGWGHQRLWQSNDGTRWSELSLPSPAASAPGWEATLVASDGPSVAVGDGDPGQAHLLVLGPGGWSEPTADPSVFGPVGKVERATALEADQGRLVLDVEVSQASQAIGSVTLTNQSLLSEDGVNWSSGQVGATITLPPGATVVSKVGNKWIAAGSQDGGSGPAVVWTGTNAGSWSAPRPLDQSPGLSGEWPAAICSGGGVEIVAGSAQAGSGTLAVVWYSHDGTHWVRASISPSPPTGGHEWMDGCTRTASGFDAFGATTAPSGGLVPALWSSSGGTRWLRQDTDSLGSPAPAPLRALATSGSQWLAVAGTPPMRELLPVAATQDYFAPWPPWEGPLLPPQAAGLAIWVSTDGGASWQREDTDSTLWEAAAGASLQQAGFAGSTAVIAGITEGRLAVWSGTPRL